jgi:hypothetical protein
MPRRRGKDQDRYEKGPGSGRQYEAAPDDRARSRARPQISEAQKARQSRTGRAGTVKAPGRDANRGTMTRGRDAMSPRRRK